MGRAIQLSVLAFCGLALPAYAYARITESSARQLLAASAVVSVLGFFITRYLIPPVTRKTQARGICGKDLNKKGTPAGDIPIPEAAGLAVGCSFLLCIILFELLHYYDINSILEWVAGGFRKPLPKQEIVADSWLVDYNAALATIGFMLFLGFADDVLDIPWRVKLLLPLFAALPLLTAYSGGTGIAVPKPVQALLGLPSFLELGILYKVRLPCYACTHTEPEGGVDIALMDTQDHQKSFCFCGYRGFLVMTHSLSFGACVRPLAQMFAK